MEIAQTVELGAVVDEIVVGVEDTVGEPIVAHESPDVFHCYGDFGSMAMIVMFGSTIRCVDMCQPACGGRYFARTNYSAVIDQ